MKRVESVTIAKAIGIIRWLKVIGHTLNGRCFSCCFIIFCLFSYLWLFTEFKSNISQGIVYNNWIMG